MHWFPHTRYVPTSSWATPLFITLTLLVHHFEIRADEPDVRFDVPALLVAKPLSGAAVTSNPPVVDDSTTPAVDEMLIEIAIPLTSELNAKRRRQISTFRFDVYWNRHAYPLVGFEPKTQTTSEIEGVISVESNHEVNQGGGVSLTGKYESLLNGNVTAELGTRDLQKQKYSEIPEHDVLVASGTSHRGTGAFFRFHPSRKQTLEGTRDITLRFRVPRSWRGGVIKIECLAEGEAAIAGVWKESIEYARVFVVPVYLEGDTDARDAAVTFVRSEQGLRKQWISEDRERSAASRPNLVSLVGLAPAKKPTLPQQWLHFLIQSGNDDYLEKFRSRLPPKLADAADQFVTARQQLLRLSR